MQAGLSVIASTLLHAIRIHASWAIAAPITKMINIVPHIIWLSSITRRVVLVLILVSAVVVSTSVAAGIGLIVCTRVSLLLLIIIRVSSTLPHHLLIAKTSLCNTSKLCTVTITISHPTVGLAHLIRLLAIKKGRIVRHCVRNSWWHCVCWSRCGGIITPTYTVIGTTDSSANSRCRCAVQASLRKMLLRCGSLSRICLRSQCSLRFLGWN
mmetsp:Transcript_10778/g.15386  ORF Transcript_10778/g.15386 Transcript_10778/m.15386 type:complete len:211 (-) Transcript_10778:1449-2081(-)